jgi:hypothetical protein
MSRKLIVNCDFCGEDMDLPFEQGLSELMNDVGLHLHKHFRFAKENKVMHDLGKDGDVCSICLWKDYMRLKNKELENLIKSANKGKNLKKKKEVVKLINPPPMDSGRIFGCGRSCGC